MHSCCSLSVLMTMVAKAEHGIFVMDESNEKDRMIRHYMYPKLWALELLMTFLIVRKRQAEALARLEWTSHASFDADWFD